jgi:hypothetical protein
LALFLTEPHRMKSHVCFWHVCDVPTSSENVRLSW